jgi:hypothetical protein
VQTTTLGSDGSTQRYRNRVILERPIMMYSQFVMWEKFSIANDQAWSRLDITAGVIMPLGRTSEHSAFITCARTIEVSPDRSTKGLPSPARAFMI